MTFHFDDITVMFLVWVLVLHPLVAWRGVATEGSLAENRLVPRFTGSA